MNEILQNNVALMGIASGLGYWMKYRSQESKRLHSERMAEKQFAEISMERAAGVAGPWIRRFIVFSVIFALIYALFIIGFTDTPVVVVEKLQKTGLLGRTREILKFHEVKGFVMLPEVRSSLMAIIGFYFGQGAAK